jgi:hypothetical protein
VKVAIYDPDPYCGGLMTWGRQMQAGLRAAGAECDVVSLTRSGKPRVSWGRPSSSTEWYERPLDRTGAYKNCRDFLAEYDRIVLTEPLAGLQDKEAKKQGWSVPYYARVLEVAGVPFTTVLQSFSYAGKDAPFAEAVVSLPSFLGTGFAHADPSKVLGGNQAMEAVKWVQAPHPYAPVLPVDAAVPPRGVAGCTGRFAHINAFQLPAVAAARGLLPRDCTVQLRGSSAVSARASFTFEVFEAIRDGYGMESWREGDGVIRPHPWVLWVNDGAPCRIIRYDGAYPGGAEGTVEACRTMQAHVSLMSRDKSTWVTNYAQLEAMDAGSVPVATDSHWSAWFRGKVIGALPTVPSVGLLIKDAGLHRWLAAAGDVITAALELADQERAEYATCNRTALRDVHQPAASARVLLEVLGG